MGVPRRFGITGEMSVLRLLLLTGVIVIAAQVLE
jgi:hypothetical protein